MGKDKKVAKITKKELNKKAEKVQAEKHGRTNHTNGNASANAENTEGCICPAGCLVGMKITTHDVVGVGAATKRYVKVFCSNAERKKCDEVPFMHEVCFDKWEEQLMAILRMRKATSDWNDEKVRRNLWMTDGSDYCFRNRKCPCGGFLTRVDPEDEALPKPTEKAEKNAAKAAVDPESFKKKQLPVLVSTTLKAGRSLYKNCPGTHASGHAATYASGDYANRAIRDHNRPKEEIYAPKRNSNGGWFGDPDDDDEFSDKEEVSVAPKYFGAQRPPTSPDTEEWNPWMRQPRRKESLARQNSASGTSSSGRRQDGWNQSPFEVADDDEEETVITEEDLIREIKGLLGCFGDQLDLDNELLTGILGRVDGELMVAICDEGGVGAWLSKFPEFDVVNDRVRLVRNVRRTPARLQTSGVILAKTDVNGSINCPSYECIVYFDVVEVTNFHELRQDDIVQVEAYELRPPIEGYAWKASSVTLLQRETEPLFEAARRSVSSEFKAPSPNIAIQRQPLLPPYQIDSGVKDLQPQRPPVPSSEETRPKPASGPGLNMPQLLNLLRQKNGMAPKQPMPVAEFKPNGTPAKQPTMIVESEPNGMPVKQPTQFESKSAPIPATKKELQNGKPEMNKAKLAEMVRELTNLCMPTGDPWVESIYADDLAMVKSWDESFRRMLN